MIVGILILLVCQLVGEFIVRLFGLPIPGPVAGMVILLIALRVREHRFHKPIANSSDGLLKHLQLLFVPAGVGVIVYLQDLGAHAGAISAGLWGSWLIGLVATGWVVKLLLKLVRR